MTSPVILLARDETGNQKFAEWLKHAAKHVKSFDIFHVKPMEAPSERLGEGFDERFGERLEKHIIITSRHAAIFVQTLHLNEGSTFYVVGDDTAELLTTEGYQVALTKPNVAALIAELKKLEQRSYSYLRGEHITMDIKAELAKNDITIDEHIAYRYIENDDALAELCDVISAANSPIILPLFSARTASIISEALFAKTPAANIYAICMSEAIAEAVKHHPWASVETAKKPTIEGLANACLNSLDDISVNHMTEDNSTNKEPEQLEDKSKSQGAKLVFKIKVALILLPLAAVAWFAVGQIKPNLPLLNASNSKPLNADDSQITIEQPAPVEPTDDSVGITTLLEPSPSIDSELSAPLDEVESEAALLAKKEALGETIEQAEEAINAADSVADDVAPNIAGAEVEAAPAEETLEGAVEGTVEGAAESVVEGLREHQEAPSLDILPLENSPKLLPPTQPAPSTAQGAAQGGADEQLNQQGQLIRLLQCQVGLTQNRHITSGLKQVLNRCYAVITNANIKFSDYKTLMDIESNGGVPTQEAINELFKKLAPEALRAGSAPANVEQNAISKALHSFDALFTVRKTGFQEGDSVEAMIGRTEHYVKLGQYDKAEIELEALPTNSREVFAPYIQAIKQHQAFDRLFDKLQLSAQILEGRHAF